MADRRGGKPIFARENIRHEWRGGKSARCFLARLTVVRVRGGDGESGRHARDGTSNESPPLPLYFYRRCGSVGLAAAVN
jgi:hypothetical protein